MKKRALLVGIVGGIVGAVCNYYFGLCWGIIIAAPVSFMIGFLSSYLAWP